MKILEMTLLMAILFGCSQVSKKSNSTIEGEPNWLYSPKDGCSDSELCASGEGRTYTESDSHAKKALAGIFETKIKSEFHFSKQDFSNEEKIKIQENVEEDVNLQIEYLLKGSNIKSRFEKNEIKFSLAKLDIGQAGSIIRTELSKIDDEMESIYKLRNKIYIRKLIILFNKRELLNEKLILLDNIGSPRKIKISDINNLKFSQKNNEKLKIVPSDDMPSVLVKKFEEYLVSMGFVLTKENTHNFLIKLDYKKKDEYLNVQGFSRYGFSINIDAYDGQSKKIGGYAITKVSSGRNEQDAFLKVRALLLKEIENNIEKLNLN